VAEEAPTIASAIAAQPYCWLTTTGLRTGRARTVELWFAADGATVYVLSGGRDRSAWVRNLQAEPRATLRLGSADHQVTARLDFESTDEADRARLDATRSTTAGGTDDRSPGGRPRRFRWPST
jgi:deazaflavin-dependent oxidoreductase (nitroreductase family)